MPLSPDAYESLFKDVFVILNQDVDSAMDLRINALVPYVTDPAVLSEAYRACVMKSEEKGFVSASSAANFSGYIKDSDVLKWELVKQIKQKPLSSEQYENTMKALFNQGLSVDAGFLLCMKTSFLAEDKVKIKQALNKVLDVFAQDTQRIAVPELVEVFRSLYKNTKSDAEIENTIHETVVNSTVRAVLYDGKEGYEPSFHRTFLRDVISSYISSDSIDRSELTAICDQMVESLSAFYDQGKQSQLCEHLDIIVDKYMDKIEDCEPLSDISFLCLQRVKDLIEKDQVTDLALKTSLDMLSEANFEAIRLGSANDSYLREGIKRTFSLLSQIPAISFSDRIQLQLDVITEIIDVKELAFKAVQELASDLMSCIGPDGVSIPCTNTILTELAQSVTEIHLIPHDKRILNKCLNVYNRNSFSQPLMARSMVGIIKDVIDNEALSDRDLKDALATCLTMAVKAHDRKEIISSYLDMLRTERKFEALVATYKPALGS